MQPLLHGKEISVTYSECVFIASGIQHALCMHCIVICSLHDPTLIFHVIS